MTNLGFIQVLSYSVSKRTVRTRLPFKYGIATMTEVPHVIVSLSVEICGQVYQGHAADHLPPRWFTKDPASSIEQEITEMEASITRALETAVRARAANPFMLWLNLYRQLMSQETCPPLLQHFGISLVERSVLDAFCQFESKPLWALVAQDRLGIDLGALSPELNGKKPGDFLPRRPLGRVKLRHTVGMADILWESEIPPLEPLQDGLPQSLEACIRTYGLHEFKIKLCGQQEADLHRLREISTVIRKNVTADFRFSLDGNEQFTSKDHLRALGAAVYADAQLRPFFASLSFIEQPMHRKVALSEEAFDIKSAWPRPIPFIIDESDATLADLPRALALGYLGVSHKNCKGVFKGIRNRCLLAEQARRSPDVGFLMTGEDLANIGPIALTQDLAVQALLGNDSVERNGHHYFRGLSMFPAELSAEISRLHPDLYALDRDGVACLRITKGEIDLTSINASPFGTPFRP